MPQLIVFYDETCGLCAKTAFVLAKLSLGERVVYKKANEMEQFTQQTIALQNRYQDLYSLANDRLFKGYDTYLQIAQKTPLLWPISLFMKLALIRFIGEKIYRRIADNRSCEANNAVNSE